MKQLIGTILLLIAFQLSASDLKLIITHNGIPASFQDITLYGERFNSEGKPKSSAKIFFRGTTDKYGVLYVEVLVTLNNCLLGMTSPLF